MRSIASSATRSRSGSRPPRAQLCGRISTSLSFACPQASMRSRQTARYPPRGGASGGNPPDFTLEEEKDDDQTVDATRCHRDDPGIGPIGYAQTALKWAHVYETSEPFPYQSHVWAAEEIAKRTEGRYKIDVFPASQLGKEADINQA